MDGWIDGGEQKPVKGLLTAIKKYILKNLGIWQSNLVEPQPVIF